MSGDEGLPVSPAEEASPVPPAQEARREAIAFVVAAASWLVPGLGHALLKMWGRAVICFLTVGVLVWVGAGVRGKLFNSRGNDAFDSLGYLAGLGTGGVYWGAKRLETNGPDGSRGGGGYGTRGLATAGGVKL